MPAEVLAIFALYWLTTLGFTAWVTKSNKDIERKLGKEGEQS